MMSPHAMLEFIATRDYRLMRRVNRWSAPRWVRLWMICATRGGDGWLWYALLGALLPHRASLLGQAAAAGSVFVPVRSHDYGVRGGDTVSAVLSRASHRRFVLRV
jgi:hypothetical protein